MSPEPSKIGYTLEPHEPSPVEATMQQDPLEDRPSSYEVNKNPPDYEVNENTEWQLDATEKAWKIGSPLDGEPPCPEDWATRPIPNLIFALTPLVKVSSVIREWFKTVPERDWYAALRVNAKNIPGLMRDGFHWSTADIVPGRGFILLNNRDLPREIGLGLTSCNHTRTYKLKGNEHTDIEWRGTLYVSARKSCTITSFDLNWLTQDKIILVRAYDWNSKPVYSYNWFRDRENFNVVYEGMPLKGWWPWPKASPPSQANPSIASG